MTMEYRRLGRSGLKVSVLSFGSWVSFGAQLDTALARDCMAAAWDGGVNFFDNAESYAGGESERIMGQAIRELGWKRETYVLSTKVFWGLTDGVNTKNTLNRKYLQHADRRIARALRARLRRPVVLPPIRSGDTDRGDGLGHVRHHRRAARRSTGGRRSGAPTRSAPHGRSPTSTICTSR